MTDKQPSPRAWDAALIAAGLDSYECRDIVQDQHVQKANATI